MTTEKTLTLLIGILATSVTSGCVSRQLYDSGCGVDCTYCAAPPLPYAYYPECVCHSCAAAPYLDATPHAEPIRMPEDAAVAPPEEGDTSEP